MVTRDTPYLTIYGSKKEISISLSGFISLQCGDSKWITTGSCGNTPSIGTTDNVFVTR